MPDNRNRKRPIQVKFFVDEKELSLIKARMAQLGIENMSAYLRKMAIDGYAAKPDLPERREPKNPWLTFRRYIDIQLRRSVANFLEIVKGFGMFPNKILQKVSKAEILQNARVGTAVHCLPEW